MPGTGAIRWGDISFRVRPRPPTEPPVLTRRTRQQRPSPTGVEGAGGTGGHSTAAVRAAEPESTRAPSPARLEATAGPAWPAWPGHGARGRWRGLAGLRADAFSHTSATQAPPVWRAPEGPEGTAGLRADAPSEARGADGERAGRRPPAHTAARPIKARPRGGRRSGGSTSTATGKGNPYSPRNALIAGISRTACTRPAR